MWETIFTGYGCWVGRVNFFVSAIFSSAHSNFVCKFYSLVMLRIARPGLRSIRGVALVLFIRCCIQTNSAEREFRVFDFIFSASLWKMHSVEGRYRYKIHSWKVGWKVINRDFSHCIDIIRLNANHADRLFAFRKVTSSTRGLQS